MFFKNKDKRPKFTMIYDEEEDKIVFETSGDFTVLMLAIALEELVTQNPEVFTILKEMEDIPNKTIH